MSIEEANEATADQLFRECEPPWSTGAAAGYMHEGAQLATRDGRRMGNAVVESVELVEGELVATVLTDAGRRGKMDESQMAGLFHKPEWTMDVATSIGRRVTSDPIEPSDPDAIMSVAKRISTAVAADELDPAGFDIAAGMFGQELSDAVRQIAIGMRHGADLVAPHDATTELADRIRRAGVWIPSDTGGTPDHAPFEAAREMTTLLALNAGLASENDALRRLYREATGEPVAPDVVAQAEGLGSSTKAAKLG